MDKVEEMPGYRPDRETRLALLKAVKESNKDIREVIATGNIVPIMPETAILDSDNRFYYMKAGTRIALAEWEKINPLHEFCQIVVITTQSRKDNLKNIT